MSLKLKFWAICILYSSHLTLVFMIMHRIKICRKYFFSQYVLYFKQHLLFKIYYFAFILSVISTLFYWFILYGLPLPSWSYWLWCFSLCYFLLLASVTLTISISWLKYLHILLGTKILNLQTSKKSLKSSSPVINLMYVPFCEMGP